MKVVYPEWPGGWAGGTFQMALALATSPIDRPPLLRFYRFEQVVWMCTCTKRVTALSLCRVTSAWSQQTVTVMAFGAALAVSFWGSGLCFRLLSHALVWSWPCEEETLGSLPKERLASPGGGGSDCLVEEIENRNLVCFELLASWGVMDLNIEEMEPFIHGRDRVPSPQSPYTAFSTSIDGAERDFHRRDPAASVQSEASRKSSLCSKGASPHYLSSSFFK